MPTATRPAQQSDTDRQILAALDLSADVHVIDRDDPDPHRLAVVATSAARTPGYLGVAVIQESRWVLACFGCEAALDLEDGEVSYCEYCKDLLAAEADGVDVR